MKSVFKPTSIALAVALGLFSAMTLAATKGAIDPAGVHVAPEQQNGVIYLNGGIGQDESNAIKAAKGYNLKMTFSAAAKHAYLADVAVDVRTRDGKQMLALNDAGQLVFAKLPAWQYDISASSGGQTLTRTVTIGSGVTEFSTASAMVGAQKAGPGRAANFHWGFEVD